MREAASAPTSGAVTADASAAPVRIVTRGRFAVFARGQPLRFKGKAQHRPLNLLKVLVAQGGSDVAEPTLCEALWPDSDGDQAPSAFATTLHRVRKLIGRDALHLQQGRLSLDRRAVRVPEGRARCYGGCTPYLPFLDALRRALGIRESDSPAAVEGRGAARRRAVRNRGGERRAPPHSGCGPGRRVP